jgi:hypothetical protein
MLLLIGVCLLLPFSSGNKNKICANIAGRCNGIHFMYVILILRCFYDILYDGIYIFFFNFYTLCEKHSSSLTRCSLNEIIALL